MSRESSRTPSFDRDLRRHAEFIANDNLDAAIRLFDAVDKSIERLLDFPEIGSLLDLESPRLQNARLWPVKGFENYLILYVPFPEVIEFLRIIHAAQDLERILKSRS